MVQFETESTDKVVVGVPIDFCLGKEEVKTLYIQAEGGDFIRGTVRASGRRSQMGVSNPSGGLLQKIEPRYSARYAFEFLAEEPGEYQLIFQGGVLAEENLRVFVSMAEPPAATPLERAEQLLRAYPKDEPGIAVAVIQNGMEVFSHAGGLSDLEQGLPMTLDTTFTLPSLGRALTMYAVLDLVDRGRLSLNEEVASILPNFPEFHQPITIEDLLRRKSGLRSLEILFYMVHGFATRPPSREERLALLTMQKELNFSPGMEEDYDDISDLILQEVISALSGESFPEYMRQEIFRNLHMSTATMVELGEKAEHQTQHYAWKGGAWVPGSISFTEASAPNLSVSDFSKWAQLLTTANENGNTWWGRMESFGLVATPIRSEAHDLTYYSVERAWIVEIRALEKDDYLGASHALGRLIMDEDAWPFQEYDGGGKYGGRGGRGRKGRSLAPEILIKLEGIYESPETGLRFAIQLVDDQLFVGFEGRSPIPTMLPFGTTKELQSALPNINTPIYSKMFHSLKFSEPVDGSFQVIRLNRSGVKNLLFRRVDTD